MLEQLKEYARKEFGINIKTIVVSDKTNRLYIRTKSEPDGELILYKEVDNFIDSLITKAYEEGKKEIYREMRSK